MMEEERREMIDSKGSRQDLWAQSYEHEIINEAIGC